MKLPILVFVDLFSMIVRMVLKAVQKNYLKFKMELFLTIVDKYQPFTIAKALAS